MEKLLFAVNVGQEIALRFLEGKPVDSQFGGGAQHMFSTCDNRVFYVSATAGEAITAQLRAHDVQVGDVVTITKAEQTVGRGRKQIRWTVVPVGDAREPARRIGPQAVAGPVAGERGDGTFGLAPERKAAAAAVPEPQAKPGAPMWAEVLLSHTNALVDVFAAAVKHSMRHEGVVKPDMVQSAMVTAFIALSKNSTLVGSR